jgi:hypothetical protein
MAPDDIREFPEGSATERKPPAALPRPPKPGLKPVGPESEVRGGPEAPEQPDASGEKFPGEGC